MLYVESALLLLSHCLLSPICLSCLLCPSLGPQDDFYQQLQAIRQPWHVPSDTESDILEPPEQDKCEWPSLYSSLILFSLYLLLCLSQFPPVLSICLSVCLSWNVLFILPYSLLPLSYYCGFYEVTIATEIVGDEIRSIAMDPCK